MEDAAIVVAHTHARQASLETAKPRLAVAATEHDLAAGQYAKACEDTSDAEAWRILRLLEEHHHKLAQIIKAKDQYSKKISIAGATAVEEDEDVRETSPLPSDQVTAPTAQPAAAREKTSTTAFLKPRDTPSSLAKDMASRRGIPQARSRNLTSTGAANVSPVQATGRMSTSVPRSVATAQHPKVLPTTSSITAAGETVDEGFARFYNQITAGPLSKLSSMLAFAGLPLTEAEELPQSTAVSPTASTHGKAQTTSARVSTGPDVDAIFSRAALKALEEQKRHPGSGFGPGESFYVIPTSGGTASYANILTKTREELRGAGSKDEDEFVDAREEMGDSGDSPSLGKKGRKDKASSNRGPENTLREEELQIENAALKQILDKLSHRLQAFESHAQDASMAMMANSVASHHGPVVPGKSTQTATATAAATTTTTIGGPGVNAEMMEERMRAMEAQLEREMREREKLGAENQKQKLVIAKYRSHWEQLKDSARAREKAKREKEVVTPQPE